jgi:uncharacterized protein (DUF1697 family)
MTTNYLALLRGINVGGNNKLPMKDLTEIFTASTCTDVQTYIQSGNIIFNVSPDRLPTLPQIINDQIQARFGFNIPVIIRTLEQLNQTLSHNPYLEHAPDMERLHVMFLAVTPEPEKVAKLDPHRSPPDQFSLHGQDIYLHFPNGTARSKLTNAYFDSKLGTISTVRNWRTVTTLYRLMTSPKP